MKFSKIISLCMAILLITAATSCNNTVDDNAPHEDHKEIEEEKPEELTVWIQETFNKEFNEQFAGLFDEFGMINDIKISVEVVNAASLRNSKLPSALESGELPNITYMEPASLVTYAEQGIIVPADKMIEDLKEKGTEFYNSHLAATMVEGVPYAVPFSAQSWMLWYRKDLLEEAGYDHAPETWEEMLEMAKAVTDAEKGIYGAGFSAGESSSDFDNMAQVALWSYGGSVMKDGEINLDSPESREALKMLLEFFESGTVNPNMIYGNDKDNNEALISGEACFIVNIPTIVSELKQRAPQIWENIGCAPLPAGPEGSFSLATVNMLSVLDNGNNENYWASKALSYVCNKKKLAPILELVAPDYGMVYKDTMDNEKYMSDPIVAAHMQAIASGKYYNYPDEEFTKERSLLIKNSVYINNIVNYVVVEKMPFEEALATEIEICKKTLKESAN